MHNANTVLHIKETMSCINCVAVKATVISILTCFYYNCKVYAPHVRQ